MRIITVIAAICALASVATAADAAPMKKSQPKSAVAPPTSCTGTFSNGISINVGAAVYMADVGYPYPAAKGQPAIPGAAQTVCDLHTFAWNQFLYYTQIQPGQNTARFMQLAPWYNVLTSGAQPGPYPGGSTALQTAYLDLNQAGDGDELLDVAGNAVRYDIRFDSNMYQSIVLQNLYSQAGYDSVCKPDPKNNNLCTNNNIWMSPAGANESPEPGSTEIKTAWRDFLTPDKCPQTEYFCQGRFGLVGFHFVNKTFSHGEWIWASFEHVSNAPDCAPGGDTPIASASPTGSPWGLFDPSTVPSSVLSSKMCSVTSPSPQCNTDPNPSGDGKTWVKVNVCRTDVIAAGGASTANCATPGNNNPGNVACLNATIMPQLSGVWKNYKLIGTLWTKPTIGPNNDFRIQIFQSQVSGLPYVAPVGFTHLANTAIETWLQMGATGYDPDGNNATQAGCFACHHEPSTATQVDLSHFPGKLPPPSLAAVKASLIPANSTAPQNHMVKSKAAAKKKKN
jgi:hypothetical protein